MHVGYVLKKFPRLSETFILNEILELERRGMEVTVLSLHRPDDGIFHAALSELKRPVRYFPPPKGPAFLDLCRERVEALETRKDEILGATASLLRFGRPDLWQILFWGLQVAREAETLGIDRLHAHFATIATQVSRAARAFTGIPFSFTCHAKDIYRETVDPVQFRYLAEAADFVVTVCDANRSHILENLADGRPLRVARLYNGIDLRGFHPEDRAPADPPLILGVGRLVEKKGFLDLVEAVLSLLDEGRDLRCVIVGEGEQRPEIEARIAAGGRGRIELAGMRTQGEVRRLMAEAAVFALPCVVGEDGNRDALPTVLLEAQAAGLPVVSCPVAGVAEICDGGRAGVLVPERDPGALARALGELLDDPGRREALARAGRARAEACFDLRKNVAVLAHWFERGAADTEPGAAAS